VVAEIPQVLILKMKHYSKSEFNASSDSFIHLVPSHPPRDVIPIQTHHHQDILFYFKSLPSSTNLLLVVAASPQVLILKMKHYSKSEFNAPSDSFIHLVPSHPPGDAIPIQTHHHQDILFLFKCLNHYHHHQLFYWTTYQVNRSVNKYTIINSTINK
jgi:hypothetical protein